MNLENQKLIGTNEIHIIDSLNASLLEVKVKNNEITKKPENSDLFIYVDTAPNNTPTANLKQYLFTLSRPLKFLDGISDEFQIGLAIRNNDVIMESLVIRKIGTNDEGDYVMETPIVEKLEGYPLTLFEGENYIYTNYINADIELIYPKNDDFNKMYLSNAIYLAHKEKNDGEFGLDSIYFKDAFTQTDGRLDLEVDYANIKGLTSKDNKFSLDSDGNLTVNSITTKMQTNIAGEVILDKDAPTIEINNLDALKEGGIYEFFAIGYTNSTTTTDIKVKINELTTGYHHSYINASGALTSAGGLTSRANYAQSVDDINEYLQTNGPNNSYPVIIEGRLYISENSEGKKRVNYTLRFYRAVQGGQSIWIGGGVFSQEFDNINSISLSLVNSSINFSKGSRLTVFTPLRGAKGERGEQGEKGENGQPNTLKIGTVECGEEASATLLGESPNQILNLVLPKGEKGEPGGQMSVSEIEKLIEEKAGILYPVGSIYMSVVNTDPSLLFGGTWEQIKDKFLLSAGDIYESGKIGGSAELQEHTHSIPSLNGTAASNGNHTHTLGADLDVTYTTKNPGSFSMHNNSPSGAGRTFYTGNQGAHTHNVTTNASITGSTGNGNEGNMPPYLTVYMWKRIS